MLKTEETSRRERPSAANFSTASGASNTSLNLKFYTKTKIIYLIQQKLILFVMKKHVFECFTLLHLSRLPSRCERQAVSTRALSSPIQKTSTFTTKRFVGKFCGKMNVFILPQRPRVRACARSRSTVTAQFPATFRLREQLLRRHCQSRNLAGRNWRWW